jgi:hypothetical protein
MKFTLIVCFGFCLNAKLFSQENNETVKSIKTHIEKINHSNSEAKLLQSVSEGIIENKKRGLRGGFSNASATNFDMDTVYLIQRSDNLEKSLVESYYFKFNKLVFSKLELLDSDNRKKTLFLKEEYYLNDSVVSTFIHVNKLRRKDKWRVDFNALANGYSYLKDFTELSKRK